MTAKEYDNASEIEKVLYDKTGMLAKKHPSIVEAMNEYARKIAEQAVKEELSRKDTAYLYKSVSEEVGKNILSRIKQLTQ